MHVDEIMHAVGLLQQGDRDAARTELLQLWQAWSVRDATRERCTLAHFLADTEEDAAAELEWDLCALEAATGSKGEEDQDAVDQSLDNFLPSLHLNVGDAYRRAGQPQCARRHAEIGLARAETLGEDGYSQMVRTGLERLRSRLENCT